MTPRAATHAAARSAGARRLRASVGLWLPLGLLILSLNTSCASGAESNLALHKKYTLTPEPSYALCTDAGDLQQLTDGVTAGASWRNASTVGWSYPLTPVQVLVDLRHVEPITEVRVHTVGGGHAGVFFPATILVMVGDDNKTFSPAGAADSVGLSQQRYDNATAPQIPYTFVIDRLQTRGRYVLLVLEPDTASLFLDEVEVRRGGHPEAHAARPPPGSYRRGGYRRDEVNDLVPALRARTELFAAVRALEADSRAAGDDVTTRLTQIKARLESPPFVYDVAAIHRVTDELYALRGRRLARQHTVRLDWAVANPMDQITPLTTLPDPSERPSAIELRSWQGEFEAAAVTLLNCGETALSVQARLTPLRAANGLRSPAEASFTLRQAVPAQSRFLGPVGDALVKLGDGFRLGAGRTGQLWLTFHNPSLTPGTYAFEMQVQYAASGSAAPVRTVIPGRIIVEPLALPSRPTMQTCNWAYVGRSPITAAAAQEAVGDLSAHYVNVAVLVEEEIPFPRLGADGRLQLDYDAHLRALQRYTNAEQYLFAWGLSRANPNFNGFPPPLSPAWKALMTEWLRGWVRVLQEHGVGYERFAMYPFDEYIGDKFFDLARFINQEVDGRIRVYANSRGSADGSQMERVAPYVSVWGLPDKPLTHKQAPAEKRLRSNAEVWTYAAAGPGKANPPYAYYRLQAWRAFARGDRGGGFWAYADQQKTVRSWDDLYRKGGPYGAVYGTEGAPVDSPDERIIPSRRWEAWRDGVEDYEYLVRLQSAIQQARDAGAASAADTAQQVLDANLSEVIEHPFSPDVVYGARQAISAQVLDLERR